MNNSERQQLLSRFRSSGMPGSILDVFSAYEQGKDIITEYQSQQRQQQSQEPAVATTPEEQREGLRPYHEAGDTQKSMIFKDVPPNTPFNTEGMKVPIDIKKVDEQGHLIESHKSIPPGVKSIPTGPYRGDIIETPSEGYKKGGFVNKKQTGGEHYDVRRAEKRQRQGYDVYDEETKHWSSVDPKTGKFLKDSKHPTLNKELDWYNSEEGANFKVNNRLVTHNIFGKEKKYYKYEPRTFEQEKNKPFKRKLRKALGLNSLNKRQQRKFENYNKDVSESKEASSLLNAKIERERGLTYSDIQRSQRAHYEILKLIAPGGTVTKEMISDPAYRDLPEYKRVQEENSKKDKKQTGGFKYIPSADEPLESSSTRVNVPNLPQENIPLISESDERNFSRSPAVDGQARLTDAQLEATEANEALPLEERSYPKGQDYRDAGINPVLQPTAEDVHKAKYGEGHAIQSVAIAPYVAGPGGLAKAGVKQTAKALWNPVKNVLGNRVVQLGFGAHSMVDARTRIADISKGRRWENGKWVDGDSWANRGMLGLDALMIGGGIKAAKGLYGAGKSLIYPKGHPMGRPKYPNVPNDPYRGLTGARSKKDFLPQAKNLDDVIEYGARGVRNEPMNPGTEKIKWLSEQFNKSGGLSGNSNKFVQDVFDRYSKGGKNVTDYITTRVKELKSPEGMKRLIAQELEYLKKIGWEPHGGLGAKDKTQFLNWKAGENARARILELQNLEASNVAVDNAYSINLLKHPKFWNNASYSGPGSMDILSADDLMIPLKHGTHNFMNAPGQVTGTGVRIGGKALPSSTRIGLPFVENIPTIGHEVSGHGFQARRILQIDDDAIRLLKPKDMNKLPLSAQKAYDYFRWGPGSAVTQVANMEPSAFLHELREAMLLRGLIKSRHQKITSHTIEAAKVSFKNKPMGIVIPEPVTSIDGVYMTKTKDYGSYLSNTRILDFIKDSKEVTKHLADLLNRLPAYIPVAGATGAAAVMSDNASAHQSYSHMNSLLNPLGTTSNNSTSESIEIGE